MQSACQTPIGPTADRQNGGGQHGNQGGRETGFEEIGDGTSSLVTEGTGEDTGTYKYVYSSSVLVNTKTDKQAICSRRQDPRRWTG